MKSVGLGQSIQNERNIKYNGMYDKYNALKLLLKLSVDTKVKQTTVFEE